MAYHTQTNTYIKHYQLVGSKGLLLVNVARSWFHILLFFLIHLHYMHY